MLGFLLAKSPVLASPSHYRLLSKRTNEIYLRSSSLLMLGIAGRAATVREKESCKLRFLAGVQKQKHSSCEVFVVLSIILISDNPGERRRREAITWFIVDERSNSKVRP